MIKMMAFIFENSDDDEDEGVHFPKFRGYPFFENSGLSVWNSIQDLPTLKVEQIWEMKKYILTFKRVIH